MSYIVSSQKRRLEFEDLGEALKNRAEGDSIFMIDGFGNAQELDKESLAKAAVAAKSKIPETPTIEKTEIKPETPEKKEEKPIFKYIKYGLMGAILLVVLYYMYRLLAPIITELASVLEWVI